MLALNAQLMAEDALRYYTHLNKVIILIRHFEPHEGKFWPLGLLWRMPQKMIELIARIERDCFFSYKYGSFSHKLFAIEIMDAGTYGEEIELNEIRRRRE
jgi:hypothetical protein